MAKMKSTLRVCTGCGRRRALRHFRAEKRTILGVSARCDLCHADYMRDYMKAYRKKQKAALAKKAKSRAVPKKRKPAKAKPKKRARSR